MYSLNDLPKKLTLASPLVAALGSPAYAEPTAQPAIQNNQVQQNTTFTAISDNVDAIVNLLSSANPNDQLIVNNNLSAVIGEKGVFDDKGRMTSLGITCALCCTR